jgi:hypothetical protein
MENVDHSACWLQCRRGRPERSFSAGGVPAGGMCDIGTQRGNGRPTSAANDSDLADSHWHRPAHHIHYVADRCVSSRLSLVPILGCEPSLPAVGFSRRRNRASPLFIVIALTQHSRR